MELTIATGNCCQGTDRKLPVFLKEFRPDVAVIPESSSNPAVATAGLLWTQKRADPFHCDVILLPKAWRIRQVTVGDYDGWCADDAPARSDHVPVVARVQAVEN